MTEMEAIIEQHAKFFDSLVDLVPAKHYYDGDTEKINLKYEKKQARQAYKQEFKEKYKANKRQQLDPDKAVTTLKVQQLKQAENTEDGQADAVVPSNNGSIGAFTGKALTPSERQALQEKLRQKILAQQQKRESTKSPADEAKSWLQSRREQTKQKLEADLLGKRRPDRDSDGPNSAKKAKQHPQQQQRHQQQGGEGAGGMKLAFGRIEVGGGGDKEKGAHKKTKAQLLREAEEKQQRIKELASTEEGKEVVRQEAWRSALARAKGEKVLDDPKLLRKSLKKEHKQRVKSAKAWQERSQQQQEAQKAKQNRRQENLQSRRQTKLDNKKAKREKKLLRPGFEGRKDTFIGAKA